MSNQGSGHLIHACMLVFCPPTIMQAQGGPTVPVRMMAPMLGSSRASAKHQDISWTAGAGAHGTCLCMFPWNSVLFSTHGGAHTCLHVKSSSPTLWCAHLSWG